MRDELAEERPARRFRSQRCLVVLCIAAVAEPARPAKGVQERFVCCERWKIGKESSVRARCDRGVSFAGPCRRETVRVIHFAILAPPHGGRPARTGGSASRNQCSARGLPIRSLALK